jgi:hypothetical protein
MQRNLLRQVIAADVDRLANFLTQRQFVEPHQSVEGVLRKVIARFGFSPATIENSLRWLRIDRNVSIGRLRRTELTRLSRTLHRKNRQNVGVAARELQPN